MGTVVMCGNGDGGNTAVTAVIPRIFHVNVAVIPRGWSKLLRGYRGNGALHAVIPR